MTVAILSSVPAQRIRQALHAALVMMLLAAVAAPRVAIAQGGNLGFEPLGPGDVKTLPGGWTAGKGKLFELALDTSVRMEGRASLRSRLAAETRGSEFGSVGQLYPLPKAIGRRLRLSGYIRTEAVTEGYAGFWMRIDGPWPVNGPSRAIAFDNMQARGPRGTTPWTRYEIELPVDSGATNILFGILHPGTGTAWFDSLHVEVVGPAMPRTVASAPPFAAPPRPAEDFTRLLTDAELALPPDTAAVPAIDTAWATWVRANARPVRSLGATTFEDLRFLRPLLDGRRLVQLGESGHGVREFNMAKVRMIRYLHEELGYDVLAFESSLFGCDRAGRRAGRRAGASDATGLMRSCIFGVWHTEEVRALFEYVRATQGTRRPLVLTGFDTQTSSLADSARPAFLREVVAQADADYARRVYDTDTAFVRATRGGDGRAYASGHRDRLVAFYDSLATWLHAREGTLAPSFRDDPVAPKLARQTARSMSAYVRQLASPMGTGGTEIRDLGMADNLDFVLDELHPGRKVIVWAHNFHIQHRGFTPGGRSMASTLTDSARPLRTTGTWVAERRGREVYTVGFYMYRGSNAMNTRTVIPVRPAATGSLEAILHRVPWRYAFVDLSRAERGAGTEWMWTRLTAKEWGVTPQPIIPRAEYDGILFVDTTWPPDYIVWK